MFSRPGANTSNFHAGLAVLCVILCGCVWSQAQTFKVIHTFTGGQDGAYPYAGLIIDAQGKLYGTANQGGNLTASCPPTNTGCGTVFELVRSGSKWAFRTLYSFLGGSDGQGPYGRVIFASSHGLYGTTVGGGASAGCPGGCGTVFTLKAPNGCQGSCPWTESILYSFQQNSEAFYPTGDLALDSAGDIYGTTYIGTNNPGAVYELKPSAGTWTQSILYDFAGANSGGNPYDGVVLDEAGNIYGTALAGGFNNSGTVFELSPSGSGWSATTLHSFEGGSGGVSPMAGLMQTSSGELIGATEGDGARDGGTVFSLTPSGESWQFATIYGLYGIGGDCGPWGKLTMDAEGNLYGTTQGFPPLGDYGYVFKLTPANGGWTETILHKFTGASDGSYPLSSLVFDAMGNLYGTTNLGGKGYGVVFQITP